MPRPCLLFLVLFLLPVRATTVVTAGPGSDPLGDASADGWRPLLPPRMYVKEGTALDFGHLVEPGPAGRHGFAFAREDGEIAFSDRPDLAVRFLGAAANMPRLVLPDDDAVGFYTDQLIRGGYNLFRPHFLDVMLMLGAESEGEFNPRQLERWDALAAALKAKGVYLYLDASTSPSLFIPRRDPADRSEENLYLAMYFDERARERWWQGVSALLQHVNPHTGLALREDPQVVAIDLRNEAGIYFQLNRTERLDWKVPASLVSGWQHWLEERYGELDALREDWKGGPYAPATTAAWDSFADVPLPPRNVRGQLIRDLGRFVHEAEKSLLEWQVARLRSIGVRVPVADFNNGFALSAHLIRGQLELVEGHGYHQHPTRGYVRGSRVGNTSAIAEGGSAFNRLAAYGYEGRPLFISEWGMPFWNEWRHESVLLAPTLAALQRWDLLLQHANQIPVPELEAEEGTARPFQIGVDPTLRAADRASALLYLRGDIAPHTARLVVPITRKLVFEDLEPTQGLSEDLLKAVWTANFSLLAEGQEIPPDTAVVSPLSGANVQAGLSSEDVLAEAIPGDDHWLQALRDRGAIAPDNPTDLVAGTFASDSGEVVLDAAARSFTLVTPRSEGAVLSPEAPVRQLDRLKIASRSGPLSVLASSLTAKPLAQSRHILIIAVGNSRNSGMTFTDAGRTTLKTMGQFPVLLRPVVAEFELRLDHPEGLTLWALDETGTRVAHLPVQVEDGVLRFTLDTRTGTATGPYFEITQEDRLDSVPGFAGTAGDDLDEQRSAVRQP